MVMLRGRPKGLSISIDIRARSDDGRDDAFSPHCIGAQVRCYNVSGKKNITGMNMGGPRAPFQNGGGAVRVGADVVNLGFPVRD